MRNLYLFAALLLWGMSTATAQGRLPPAYEIKTDTAVRVVVDDAYWQLLEDPTGELTIEQVTSPAYAAKFHANTTREKGYDYAVNTYWLRYQFKNTLTYPVKVAVPEQVAQAWLYQRGADGKWVAQHTGTHVPMSQRDGLKRTTTFVVTLQAGQEVLFYERNVFDFRLYKPKEFEFTIGFAEAVIHKAYVADEEREIALVLMSILVGFLLLAGCVNFIFYRIVKERVYLYFSVYVLATGFYYLIINKRYLLFPEYPFVGHYVTFAFTVIFFFAIAHFIRHFLGTFTFTPRLDKILKLASFIVVITWLLITLWPPSTTYATYLIIQLGGSTLIYLYHPLLFGTLLAYLKRTNGVTRTGIYALLPYFTWVSIVYVFFFISAVLNEQYQVPFSSLFLFLTRNQASIEIVLGFLFILVFCWILLKRFQETQLMLSKSLLEKERLEKEKEIERTQLVQKQKQELEEQVEARTAELQKSLTDLSTTQTQLVQAEKLASLGELTAGIAHEIQNPLNFVNNFSEVSAELATELKEELEAGNTEDALALADDIYQNMGKIVHHGRRADSIVKNMLQHARQPSGEKERVPVNALVDEYLRLSYHGLRAKDKSFNATLETSFDEAVGKVEMLPQEMGRVLLNLFNNAFYSVLEKKKLLGPRYAPTLYVTTRKTEDGIEIKVKDNGMGIPPQVLAKIYQPFFTTKPTGEGTGLGLSMSYDIVTKGHGGSMKAQTEEGQYAEFDILLPA